VYSFLLVRQFLRELSVDKEEGRSEEERPEGRRAYPWLSLLFWKGWIALPPLNLFTLRHHQEGKKSA